MVLQVKGCMQGTILNSVKNLVYMSTQYNDVSCRWLVAKPIVQPTKVLSEKWALQLAYYYSYCLRIPVASKLIQRDTTCEYC